MRLFLKDYVNKYKAENIIRLFYPNIELCHDKRHGDDYIYQRSRGDKAFLVLKCGGKTLTKLGKTDNLEYFIYTFLREYTGIKPPWGLLCGVRPLWLYRKRVEGGMSQNEAVSDLIDRFDVSLDKAELLRRCYDTQNTMDISKNITNYSLYISVPYCPSRCKYCSFISMASNNKKEMRKYIHLLINELQEISREYSNRDLQTIYIGGGTPTAIESELLFELLCAVNELFPNRKEFTVEAGRPDCTDAAKLRIIKDAGVDRISINPQTFCDNVLKTIGRHHNSDDFMRCYNEAIEQGHENINMDLIAGLPGDTAEGFLYSLKQTLLLNPKSITVHSFTKKSGSLLSGGDFNANPHILEMMKLRDEMLCSYNPYYIYRQKKTPANLENVGYAKKGYECLYNVYMMDELHTVISAGAGGVTKHVTETHSGIRRQFHPKYPTEYIADALNK